MQGLWATRRPARVNLNAIPPGSAAAAAALASSPNKTPPSLEKSTPLADTLVEDPPAPSTSTAPLSTSTPTPSSDQHSNGKRKSRIADGASASTSKRLKSTSTTKEKDYTPPTARLSDLGGVQACVEKMLELVAMPITHPEVYIHTGVQPPRGVLLHGPPGCGKTLFAHAIAGVCTRIVQYIWLFPLLISPFRNWVSPSSVSRRLRSSLGCQVNLRRR